MLAHRLQRWPNINTTLGQRLCLLGSKQMLPFGSAEQIVDVPDSSELFSHRRQIASMQRGQIAGYSSHVSRLILFSKKWFPANTRR